MKLFKKNIRSVFVILTGLFVCGIKSEEIKEKSKKVYCYSVWGEYYYNKNKASFFKELFKEFDVIYTNSLQNLKDFEYIVTEEVPHDNRVLAYLKQYPHEKVLLFSFETQISNPRSSDIHYHDYYSKIFTWNDDLIDNVKYYKVRYPWMDPRPIMADIPSFENRKLCVLVANKVSNTSRYENYSRRKALIEFFESNAPYDLDLYGSGWQYKVYKGSIPFGMGDVRRLEKINCLKNYKFDICFENTRGVNGWLSERIFECFAAGCIPVYSGAKNIRKYIPQECFIDAEAFKDFSDLYNFLKGISSEQYYQYLDNIRSFLNNESVICLSTRFYIQNIRKILNLRDE